MNSANGDSTAVASSNYYTIVVFKYNNGDIVYDSFGNKWVILERFIYKNVKLYKVSGKQVAYLDELSLLDSNNSYLIKTNNNINERLEILQNG